MYWLTRYISRNAAADTGCSNTIRLSQIGIRGRSTSSTRYTATFLSSTSLSQYSMHVHWWSAAASNVNPRKCNCVVFEDFILFFVIIELLWINIRLHFKKSHFILNIVQWRRQGRVPGAGAPPRWVENFVSGLWNCARGSVYLPPFDFYSIGSLLFSWNCIRAFNW